MDLKQQINRWLKNGTHEEGVELYAQCKGVNKQLLRRLRRSKLAWAKNKLKYELERLAPKQFSSNRRDGSEVKKFTTIQPSPKVEDRHNKPKSNIDSDFQEEPQYRNERATGNSAPSPKSSNQPLPFAVVEIKRLRQRAYRERDHLHANLENYETDDIRYEKAKRIVELQKLISGYWTQLNAFQATGTLPTLPEELDLKKTIVSKVKRRDIVKPNISRRKSWIKKENQRAKPDAEKIAKWSKELADFQQELAELEKYLAE